jgi:hypothetical protein
MASPKKGRRRQRGRRTPSAVALGVLLERGGEHADIIRKRFHRSLLWRLITARSLPDLSTAALLDDMSEGEVPCKGWRHGSAEQAA